jgi:hypothetical protein
MARSIYTYRTAKLRRGFASIVTVISDGEPQYNASYCVLPTRSKAYHYAQHMATIGAINSDGHVCHYDKWSTAMWSDLERPGGCGAQRIAILWTAKSSNSKTGPMPVSTTSKESCPRDCAFRVDPKTGKDGPCYAMSGPLSFLWQGLTDHGPNATWRSGVAKVTSTDWNGLCRNVEALAPGSLWRHNQAGDLPHKQGKIDRAKLLQLVKANRGRHGFTYSHHNVLQSLHNQRLIQSATSAGFTINLSGNNLAHADQLADLGVAPVVCVLPSTVSGNVKIETPKGRRVMVCPATYRHDVSCKTCGLCAVASRGVLVGFPSHGARKRAANDIAVK